MYYNEEHEEMVNNRGDKYTYIGSYRYKEMTIDGKKSESHIRVKCPYCGKEYDIRLNNFKIGHKCTNCCNSYENSFAHHIQMELGEGLNKYWDWEKNELNPYLISKAIANKQVWIKCNKKDYHDSYKTTPAHFKEGKRCPYCCNQKVHPKDSFGQWLIDEFGNDAIKKYWSPKNIVNSFNIAPKSTSRKIWILCQNKSYHNDNGGYLVTPSHFTRENSRCPYCSHKNHKMIHKLDSFGSLYPEKVKYWSSNNEKSPFEVAPMSNKKYKFICQECGKEFERSLNKLNRYKNGVYCNECNCSQLEHLTKDILNKYKINYDVQVEYNNLIGLGGGNLSYDFYLPNYNFLIECQGIQHKKFTPAFHKTEEDFKKQLEHDRRKKEYAKEHNINLLEIWYYDIDNIEEILLETLQIKNN